jgi:hypothetical protein
MKQPCSRSAGLHPKGRTLEKHYDIALWPTFSSATHREDAARIETLITPLQHARWTVSWDRDIPAGVDWREQLYNVMNQALCVLVIWSRNSYDDGGLSRRLRYPSPSVISFLF